MDSPNARTATQNVLTQYFLNARISWGLYFYYFYFLWGFQKILAIAFTENIWTPNSRALNVVKYQKISDPYHWDMVSTFHFFTVYFCFILSALSDFPKLSCTLTWVNHPICSKHFEHWITFDVNLRRRSQISVKHLRWSFWQKFLAAFGYYLFSQKVPSLMFDKVLNTPLLYKHISYWH